MELGGVPSPPQVPSPLNTSAPGPMVEPWVAELFARVENNDITTVSAVVSARRDALDDVRNDKGETCLITACRLGLTEMVQMLVALGPDVNATDDEMWSPLLNAAFVGDFEITKVLLEKGADIEQTDALGWPPLMWASYRNKLQIAQHLLEKGAKVNIFDDEDSLSPLMVACGRGFTLLAGILIDHEANVNACDKFGNTALIWASRKGHTEIVERLLTSGAEIDAVGMYSSTALILATRGNYFEIAELLLERDPNVNAVDKDGYTALSIAAREGYTEIAAMLLETGAYVNVVDHNGDPILLSAVRSGNVAIVKGLLHKYADINAKDGDGRTPLHLAVDKGYSDIILALLDQRPNLEVKNKDGDTALMRAVKCRSPIVAQMLLQCGAKVATTDRNGDNCLHVSMRARSRRLTQLLLARPRDARLLYRPNHNGETPYSIDQSHAEPILPHIFGPVESQTQTEALLGYDVYSHVLADIVCEPNLSLPLTIGLYAKWGSGKSFLINKMKESMELFSRSWLDPIDIFWSWSAAAVVVLLGFVLALIVYGPTAVVLDANWIPALAVALVFDAAVLGAYAGLYYGSQVQNWDSCVSAGLVVGRYLVKVRLFLHVLFYQPPQLQEKDLLACPVSFLFGDYHRLSSIGGEQALAKIVVTLVEAVEKHYGRLTTRLYSATQPNYARGGKMRLRRFCGIPVLYLVLISIFTLLLGLFLLTYFLQQYGIELHDAETEQTSGLLASGVFLTFAFLMGIYPTVTFFVYGCSSAPKRRLKHAVKDLPRIKFEGFMQHLQQEVDLLAELISCMNSFTQSQTRLVVVVDGLDNCEQERMVQTLDALELLFSSRQNRPFIVIIAVDPHIIINAIEHNIRSALTGTDLGGYDYLRNIVNMPFYLNNAALRQLHKTLEDKRQSVAQWHERYADARQEVTHEHGSFMSLQDGDQKGRPRRPTHTSISISNSRGMVGVNQLSQTVIRDDYFSNINPRSMRRTINTLNLTGRLLRAFEIEFTWLHLGEWISLVEQWPFRISWIIAYCEMNDSSLSDPTSLKELYENVRHLIPKLRKEDPMLEMDRNPQSFDTHLTATSNQERHLTVAHLRAFLPCTANLDPYILKLIRERMNDQEDVEYGELKHANTAPSNLSKLAPLQIAAASEPPDTVKSLFRDYTILYSVQKPLDALTTDEVSYLVVQLDIPETRRGQYSERIHESNLSGLVLNNCELDALRQELQMTLGDWTLFRLLLEVLRDNGHLMVVPPMSEHSASIEPISASPGPAPKRRLSVARSRSSKSLTIPVSPKKSLAQKEVESHQQWLMEHFGRMDTVEFAGDVNPVGSGGSSSRPSSVKFEDDTAVPIDLLENNEPVAPAEEESPREKERGSPGSNAAASSGDSTASVFGSTDDLMHKMRSTNDGGNELILSEDHKDSPLRTSAPLLPLVTQDEQEYVPTSITSRSKSSSVRAPRTLHGKLVRQYTAESSKTNDSDLREALLDEEKRVMRESSGSVSDDEHQLTILRRPASSDGRVEGKDKQRPVLFGLWRKDSKSSGIANEMV